MINLVKKFIEAILEENRYCKQMIKKHSNKNLVMSAEDERRFHDHVTGKYRGSTQWSHNINLKLNEKYSCNIS